MKKRRQVFAILTLCGLLMVLISFSGCSHLQVKSNQSHDKTAVVLDNQSLFKIYALVGSLTPEERAKKITQRISAIAQDTSIEVDSLKVEEGNGTTNIISDREVFITLTDIDAQKADQLVEQLHKLHQPSGNPMQIVQLSAYMVMEVIYETTIKQLKILKRR